MFTLESGNLSPTRFSSCKTLNPGCRTDPSRHANDGPVAVTWRNEPQRPFKYRSTLLAVDSLPADYRLCDTVCAFHGEHFDERSDMSVRKVSAPVSAWLEDQVRGLTADQILTTAGTLRLRAALIRVDPASVKEAEMLDDKERGRLAKLLSLWARLLEIRCAEMSKITPLGSFYGSV